MGNGKKYQRWWKSNVKLGEKFVDNSTFAELYEEDQEKGKEE